MNIRICSMVYHEPLSWYLAAKIIVADIEVPKLYILEELGHPSFDMVVAEVQIGQVVGKPDLRHVERELIP